MRHSFEDISESPENTLVDRQLVIMLLNLPFTYLRNYAFSGMLCVFKDLMLINQIKISMGVRRLFSRGGQNFPGGGKNILFA